MSDSTFPSWQETRDKLCQSVPDFYELEPGGALALSLEDDDWMLELTPDGRIICQAGMDMGDIQSLLSDGTPEDLGTDELAKQAKYYLQPIVSKFRRLLLGAGFVENTEMTDQYVAVTFERAVDLNNLDEVRKTVTWCRERLK
jgi:hypothetical protein